MMEAAWGAGADRARPVDGTLRATIDAAKKYVVLRPWTGSIGTRRSCADLRRPFSSSNGSRKGLFVGA